MEQSLLCEIRKVIIQVQGERERVLKGPKEQWQSQAEKDQLELKSGGESLAFLFRKISTCNSHLQPELGAADRGFLPTKPVQFPEQLSL